MTKVWSLRFVESGLGKYCQKLGYPGKSGLPFFTSIRIFICRDPDDFKTSTMPKTPRGSTYMVNGVKMYTGWTEECCFVSLKRRVYSESMLRCSIDPLKSMRQKSIDIDSSCWFFCKFWKCTSRSWLLCKIVAAIMHVLLRSIKLKACFYSTD